MARFEGLVRLNRLARIVPAVRWSHPASVRSVERRVSQLGRVVVSVMPIIGCLQMPRAPSCGSEGTSAIISGDRVTGLRWPNEPAGFTVLSDGPFHALMGKGGRMAQRRTTNGSGVFLTTDATAPVLPSSVLQFTYEVGFPAGYEPGVAFYDPATPVKQTYFGFWWKPSNPWQPHPSGVNKIAFLFSAAGNIYIMMYFDGRYTIHVETQFPSDTRNLAPNVTTTPVVLGAWHRIEWFVKYSSTTTSRDGAAQWWLDGVLQGGYKDLQMPGDVGFTEYQLAPTWGGMQGTKIERDCYWYEHAHISQP